MSTEIEGIDIQGLDRADLLAALYNASKPQGMGFIHFNPAPMTRLEAAALLDHGHHFDYLRGRVMKITLKPGANCSIRGATTATLETELPLALSRRSAPESSPHDPPQVVAHHRPALLRGGWRCPRTRDWKGTRMMTLNSYHVPLCPVALPYRGRQWYMHSFDLADPIMCRGFEDYLEPVRALCAAAGATSGTAYMTVDEKIVGVGETQRRPGPHVDGCFMPGKPHRYLKDAIGDWSGGGGGGGWRHNCNRIPFDRMPVIVAASEVGCRAWTGRFEGEPRNDGDLSHLDIGAGVLLESGRGYWLSPDCIHESLVMERPTLRTFLRIALPVTHRMVQP